MLDMTNKDYFHSLLSGAITALQSELGFPYSGDLDLDEKYATAVVISVLNEVGADLPKEYYPFLVDIQNGKYKSYFKNIIENESQDK